MSDKNIVSFSSQIDLELAENLRKKGCSHCGGVLHFARYERVNKNLSTESEEPSHNKFHSLCCSVEGCRKRARPLSIRYAGRSPFSMALFLLVELIKSRGSKRSVIALRKELQISERTIHRWLAFWKKVYTQSIWWRKVSSIWMLSGRTVKELWPLLIKTQTTSWSAFKYLLLNSNELWNEIELFGGQPLPAKDVTESNSMSVKLNLLDFYFNF